MDYETTRQIVLEILREKYCLPNCNLQFGGIIHEVEKRAISNKFIQEPNTTGYTNTPNLPDSNVEHILDFMNSLLHEGVIRWGLNRLNLDPPFMSITAYGCKVLANNEPTPYDPDGYLNDIKSKIALDDTSELYLTECIQTFQRGNYLSSAVMLGVSAESIFNNMYNCFISSLKSPKVASEFERLRKTSSTKRRIDLVTDTIKVKATKEFPKEIVDNFDSKTSPILNLIRRLRNDVGHPTGIEIKRMEMFVNLMLFKVYCDESRQIIEFLKNNEIMKEG